MLVRFGNDETSIVPPSLGELVPQVMLVTLDGEESVRPRTLDGTVGLLLVLLVNAVCIVSSTKFTAPVKIARKPVIVVSAEGVNDQKIVDRERISLTIVLPYITFFTRVPSA